MRYSLRTLLIVVTLTALVFARIGYLKRIAYFHQREAERIAINIAAVERDSIAEVQRAIQRLADGRPAPNDKLGSGNAAVFGYGLNVRAIRLEAANDWRRAIWHKAMANEYDRDIFRLRPSTKPEPY
jgi:hypothetical protein